MSFFGNLFRSTRAESVLLIDIGASSVAGAYARYEEGQQPALAFVRRLPIEIRADEPPEQAMLRALQVLSEVLIREGAPALARLAGSGAADTILVSVDAPWQETAVRTEHFEGEKPFVFTRHLLAEAIAKVGTAASGKTLSDESVIGTTLNGYETKNPYGKRARRAAVVILTSFITESVAASITASLQGQFHTRNISFIAGSSVRYQALRAAFPHDHDVLILDATGPLVAIALVRKGLLAAVSETPDGAVASSVWAKEVRDSLAELAKHYPLPPSIFILAHEQDLAPAQEALASGDLGSLWLSSSPPKMVGIQPSHMSALVRLAGSMPVDLPLLLMAVYRGRPSIVEKV